MASNASAPPVVLVHGFGTSFELTWVANGWADLLAEEGRDVIGVDLLGHGTAPKPHDPAAYADLGERIVEMLPDVPVDAIGFSLGARTLLDVASGAPEKFRSLVVSGVGENIFREQDFSRLAEAIRTADDGGDPTLRYFAGLGDLPGSDRAALTACMTAHRGPVDPSVLARITCPVLVVLGEHDVAGPADPLVEALANPTFVSLPGTDHARTPKSFEFIDAALDFLRRQDG